ncbi:MAG: OmpA family protein [Myxococcota bacterium]
MSLRIPLAPSLFAWSAVLIATLLSPGVAHAGEPWLLSVEAGAQIPVGDPQRDWFGPGATGTIALRRAIRRNALIGLKVRGGFLVAGDGPSPDSGYAERTTGTLYTFTLGLRLRPFGRAGDPSRGTGLLLDGDGGVARTGPLWRGYFEAGLGYGFAIGRVTVAPFVRYLHVIQPPGNLDSSDANLLSAGIELTFFDRRPQPVVEEPPPPRDSDRDGYVDPEDGCPQQPEDFDDFEDEDGCPDPDNDQDGILDDDDGCPLEPEDADGFEDEDGCPDPDNDADGFLDEDDLCPNEAEVVNGVDDHDGCPDEGLIEMVDDRIVLDENVFFDFERARVKSRARPVIAAIVELVRQHPEWRQMRVEGHADVRGNEEYNLSLSQRRARNVVRALVRAGLIGELLVHEGFGSSQPRDSGRSEDAHQRNRRVEFVVVEVEPPEETETGEEVASAPDESAPDENAPDENAPDENAPENASGETEDTPDEPTEDASPQAIAERGDPEDTSAEDTSAEDTSAEDTSAADASDGTASSGGEVVLNLETP